jgi:hypothetical protein
VEGLRVDIMATLHGCDAFPKLWRRRLEVRVSGRVRVAVIGLRDLVQCKKTQRDKDWFMLRRLVDNDVRRHEKKPSAGQVCWWLQECRSPEVLIDLCRKHARLVGRVIRERLLLAFAQSEDRPGLAAALSKEEEALRERDRAYWAPLRKELEMMRRRRK